VTIGVGDGSPELFRARFEGTVPMVLANDGRVTIEYPKVSPAEWLRPNRRGADVWLDPSLPWELVFGGGVSVLRADLRGIVLRSLEIMGGASEAAVFLPEPERIASVRVGGGAGRVSLLRPPGTAVILAIAGGSSRLVFDERRYEAVSRGMRLATAGAGEASDRYEIEIGGGAGELTIA
jgi:hypothetical protein